MASISMALDVVTYRNLTITLTITSQPRNSLKPSGISTCENYTVHVCSDCINSVEQSLSF